MRLLHLHRPHLPLELARARASEPFPPGPLVLGGRPWDPGPVIDASPDARALGVRRGMPLGSAHRLVPEATFLDPDPDADRATVEAAFEALAAFSPGIAGSADPARCRVRAVRGPDRRPRAAVGPEPVLVERLVEALAGARGGDRCAGASGIRAGIAGTRFAATIAAVLRPARCARPRPARRRGRVPRPASVRPPHHRPRRPRPAHPVRAAPDRGRRRAAPDRAGRPVRRGGRADPRPGPRRGARAVPRRAGRPERLGLGLPIEPAGRGPRAAPLRPPSAGRRPDRPARRARAGGRRARGSTSTWISRSRRAGTPPSVDVEQRFPEPTADAEAIERLLFARLERTPPPAAVARLDLELDGTAPAAGQQLPLFTPQAARGRPARLAARAARPDVRGGSRPAGGRHRPRGAAPRDALGVAAGRLGRTGSGLVTRLLREHPAIDVELDAAGAPRSPSAGTAGARPSRSATAGGSRRPGGAARSPATTSRSSATAGSRSSTSTASTGSWHLERLYD